MQFSEERLSESRPFNRRINITEDGKRDVGGGYEDNAVSGDFAAVTGRKLAFCHTNEKTLRVRWDWFD